MQCTPMIIRALGLVALVTVTACATQGSESPSAHPVFYPNAKLNAVGAQQARRDGESCMAQAQSAGLTPQEKDNAVAQGAVRGAAAGGVAAAVGSLITGNRFDKVLENGGLGAAVGGSAGAVAGAFHEKPSATYRNYVHRCLSDMGYEVIGWN